MPEPKIATRIKNRGGAYINVIIRDPATSFGDPKCRIECTGCGHAGTPYSSKQSAMAAAENHAARCAFEPAEG